VPDRIATAPRRAALPRPVVVPDQRAVAVQHLEGAPAALAHDHHLLGWGPADAGPVSSLRPAR
jgi:hypothetical protein